MPDQHPYYSKVPRPESIDKFIEYLNGSKVVTAVKRLSTQVILVERNNGPSIKVFLTNIYIVGVADVVEIQAKNLNVDAIVTMSAWNSYTSDAKDACRRDGIGLFKFNEFLGAVYRNGERFLAYGVREDDS